MQKRKRKNKTSFGASLLLLLMTLLCVFCENNEKSIDVFNPLSEKAENDALRELGEKLFFDKKLSIDNSIACANCHIPALAFTDGDSVSTGVHGRMGFRNSPSLFNVVNQDKFMWDGGVKTLELQALVPLQDTNEMSSMISELIPKLSRVQYYDSMSRVITGDSFNPSVLTRSTDIYGKFAKGAI